MARINHTNLVLCIVGLTVYIPIFSSIDCDDRSPCECINDEPCYINCNGFEMDCQGSTSSKFQLICKQSQPCFVNCSTSYACESTTVIANDAANLTILCGAASTDLCTLDYVRCDSDTLSSCTDLNIETHTLTPAPLNHPLQEENAITMKSIATSDVVIVSGSVLVFVCVIWVIGFLIISRHRQYIKNARKNSRKNTKSIASDRPETVNSTSRVRLTTDDTTSNNINIVPDDESETSSSSSPPPPPLTISMLNNPTKYKSKVTVQSSATTIYECQRKYNEELNVPGQSRGSIKSVQTVLTIATDVTDESLYAIQNEYLLQEMGLTGLRVMPGQKASISETDVSLYRKQHEYLEAEVNEMEDAQETPGNNEQIETQNSLEVIYDEDNGNRRISNTEVSIYIKQQEYLQLEREEEKDVTPGRATPGQVTLETPISGGDTDDNKGNRTSGRLRIEVSDASGDDEEKMEDEAEEKMISPRRNVTQGGFFDFE